jgi:hypothetical protein
MPEALMLVPRVWAMDELLPKGVALQPRLEV